MRQNPGEFAPRTAPEADLQETLVGTALVLGLFAVLFTALVVPAVGVVAAALVVGAVLVRFGRGHLRVALAARRRRRARLAAERSRTDP
jgi:hypothetical protein